MIYVSSSCVRNDKITESVIELAEAGFNNIELSGGTHYYDHSSLVNDLLVLKERYNLNYLLHNYFPPPESDFVLNLASLDKEINQKSLSHVLSSIEMSVSLGAKYYGFHAGFFLDIGTNEIGKKITTKPYEDKTEAESSFYKNFKTIKAFAENSKIEIFVENNVYSTSNYGQFGNTNPLMLMNKEDYHSMKKEIDFNLLLDVAHLKVSCNTLEKDFEAELTFLNKQSKYIHISDNDSLEDSNRYVKKESSLFEQLQAIDLKNKVITLEIYESIDKIKETYSLINSLL